MVSSSRNSELQTYATIIRIVSFDAPSFTYTYNNCLSSRYQPFRKHPGSTTTALPSTHSYTSAQVPTKSTPPPALAHTKRQEHNTSTDSLTTTLYLQDTQQALHSHTRACKIPSTQNPPGLTPSGQNQKRGGYQSYPTRQDQYPLSSLYTLLALAGVIGGVRGVHASPSPHSQRRSAAAQAGTAGR